MKRVIIYLLALVCLLSFVSCTGRTTIKSGDIHEKSAKSSDETITKSELSHN